MTVPPVAVVMMPVVVMAVVVMAVVMTVHAVMAAATAHAAAAMAAAVTTGLRTRGERRQADNDCCGKGEDCSTLEHSVVPFVCSAGGHPRSRARFLAQGAVGDSVGGHKMLESETARTRGTCIRCAA